MNKEVSISNVRNVSNLLVGIFIGIFIVLKAMLKKIVVINSIGIVSHFFCIEHKLFNDGKRF